jgi:thiamine biosynthesis lipoprotein
VTTFRFPAMGTEVEAWGSGEKSLLADWFERVESVASRFRPRSELSAINRREGPVAAPLSPLMAELLGAAERARRITGGLVDVGVGGVVKSWGYDRTFADVSDLELAPPPAPVGDWAIDGRVLRRSPGVEIDLGGIAKGWASDRAVEMGLADVVSAGGDLRSVDSATTAAITDDDGRVAVMVRVGQGALATSSVGKRRWSVAGSDVSHIVDPRTMRPVRTPLVSASVLAGTAVDAEAGAKAVLLLGEDGLAWAGRQSWVSGAIVIWNDGSIYGTPGLEVAA